ncbi:16S rRNA (uracil(1498)-N(3))-methyltransferase [Nitrincola nitratireducens]|uniref:Ribosomal RNA small subunit methyltransferase E n=1 Tax=Nitrincola nitratireducens TaxID=1229521 RepID=W9V661_9GAMM|nr:16S rRNA (uracil(1498)-N(3))-methyltransferase [Nitrincola nitratireducens]EXJ12391.1 Ribosomal RNA small subunit methyltransferase E [Nitrincola nitratireducens]
MRIPRFYDPQPMAEGMHIDLGETATQHALKALRLREGDALSLFNNDGHEYRAEVVATSKTRMQVKILHTQSPERESPLKIEIGQALSRGERMDYAIQKSTEMGCTRISPLFTERCEVKLSHERQDKRQRHWQQIAVSACEQSLRCVVPEVHSPRPLAEWLQDVQADLKLVLHHHSAQPLADFQPPSSVALLIGPEGGLTEAEVELAIAQGFYPVALGPRVMRTETAPVAATALLHYLWGDLGPTQQDSSK